MIIFYVFAAVAVGASLLVIAQRNPIYSVLLLIASFGALSGLYVMLDAPFVAVIQIVVSTPRTRIRKPTHAAICSCAADRCGSGRFWPWCSLRSWSGP
jgi:hypothetical protein